MINMNNASHFMSAEVLNHLFRNTPTPSPQQVFLALYISDPTDADIGTEVQGGGYARQPATFTVPVASTELADKFEITNSAEVRFPEATESWGSISHFGIRDAATGGNLLMHGSVPTPRVIEAGDEAIYRPNSLRAFFG